MVQPPSWDSRNMGLDESVKSSVLLLPGCQCLSISSSVAQHSRLGHGKLSYHQGSLHGAIPGSREPSWPIILLVSCCSTINGCCYIKAKVRRPAARQAVDSWDVGLVGKRQNGIEQTLSAATLEWKTEFHNPEGISLDRAGPAGPAVIFRLLDGGNLQPGKAVMHIKTNGNEGSQLMMLGHAGPCAFRQTTDSHLRQYCSH